MIPHLKIALENQLLFLIDFKRDSNPAGSKLLVCLHKLWLTQHLTEANDGWKSGIIWKVDCFQKVGEKFSYLCALDTAIEGGKNIRFNAGELIPLCLQLSAEKIESALNRQDNPYQSGDLNQFKKHFNDIPILNDIQKKKGLYLTYQQFLNNTPAVAEFEIERDKLTDALFAHNSKGSYELIRNVWGYCDGYNMYIKSGEKYFQLCRVDNTFYFYGAEDIRKSAYSDPGTASLLNVATNSNRKITKYYLSYYPFQLDIESGNFY